MDQSKPSNKAQSSDGVGNTKWRMEAQRVKAVDTNDSNELFPIANFLKSGSRLPGIYRNDELNPKMYKSS